MSPYSLLDPAVRLADTLVVAVSHALTWPGGGASVVAGVVVVTLLVRACLLPLALRGVRADRARTALRPELERIRKRHAGDSARIASETAQAYRSAGVSPFAGVGPALLQLPVLATAYRVVVAPTVGGHPNVVLSASVLGGPLSAHWPVLLSAAGLASPAGLGLALLLAALTGIAWVSSRQLAARAAAAGPAGAGLAARLGRLTPYLTVGFAALSPLGVGFYLVVTTGWSAAERALLPRFA
jgi:YidC/Oxa1 family membrane protein insertase